MRAGKQYTPLIYSAAATFAGSAIAAVLLSTTSLESWILPEQERPKLLGTLPPLTVEHVVYHPSESEQPAPVVPATPPPAKPQTAVAAWHLNVTPRSAHTETWSTETQRITPPVTRPAPTAKPKQPASNPKRAKKRKKRDITLKSRLAEISPGANTRLAAKFRKAGASWPPADIAFVAIKDERVLELHARSKGGSWKFIHRYPVLAASGGLGPKLRQGDRQVPEGVYRIVYLNPRSAYHVSLRVNYPNAFDRKMARKEKRKKLGGDIMVHGKRSSAGCLAMGDDAVEELFVLSARTGYSKTRIIIAPTDFRTKNRPLFKPGQPKWLPQLYTQIASAMKEFKSPPQPPAMGLLSFFTQ
ncbi:MAG: L,D-transpeptidase family protein [Hyphomicrobiaceae bacterium]